MNLRALMLVVAACGLASSAAAQGSSFNLDVGTGSVPSWLYGAAAGQTGVWNVIPAGVPWTAYPLMDLGGTPTNVSVDYTSGFDFAFDNVHTLGDDAALLDDAQALTGMCTWSVYNLRPGNYEVWTYAWAPDIPVTYKTRVSVVGSSDPAQIVGGHDWNGTFVQDWNYALHHVTVAPGAALEIDLTVFSGGGTVNGIQVRELTPPMTSYCTPGTTTHGCTATLAGVGLASASASSGFQLVASNVEGQKLGLIFYGNSGRIALPWGTSTSWLCVRAPTQRTPSHGSGGTVGACDGSLSIDWNAYMSSTPGVLGQPRAAGDVLQSQAWFRDPASVKTTNLSDALEFTLAP